MADDLASPSTDVPSEPTKPKPSLMLSDDEIDDAGLSDCAVGDSYTATITFKVVGANERDDHRDKTLEIDSITDTAPAGEAQPDDAAEPDADDAETPATNEEDVLGYKRPPAKEGIPVDLNKLRSV